jgi:hypothetical protein
MDKYETSDPMEHCFESLVDAIVFAFRQEQTSLLSLSRICEVLQAPNLFINFKKEGLIPCSSIIRRRISSTLSACELFVKAGAPRTCVWAIRPNNPLFLSDGAISTSIEQMLTSHGPMTLEDMVAASQLNGADISLFEQFLANHPGDFAANPDGTYWFPHQPPPIIRDFESISQALSFALSIFPEGASVEEVTRFLCLATVGGSKVITRRYVSRELSRRPDLFQNLSRARYKLIEKAMFLNPGEVSAVKRFSPPEVGVLSGDLFQIGVGQFSTAGMPMPVFSVPTITESAERLPRESDDFDPFNFFNRDSPFSFD